MRSFYSAFFRIILFGILISFYSGVNAQCSLSLLTNSQGCIPYLAKFSYGDSSHKTIQSYQWDFGDGNGSTASTGTHIYTASGSYTPTLKFTFTDNTTCTATLSSPLKVWGVPKASMQLPVVSKQCFNPDFSKNRFSFNNKSTRSSDGWPIVSYLWNFGDGDTSTVQNPTHTYQAPGSYNVSLKVTDSKGCSDIQIINNAIILFPLPYANISVTGANNCGTSTYKFQVDTNKLDVKKWYWDFGDGSKLDSTSLQPSHTYTTDGSFTVNLRLVNRFGCEYTASTSVMNTVFNLKISFTDPVCFANNEVQFNATQLTGTTFLLWTFGDPASGPQNRSVQWNTSHHFTGPGTYHVTFQMYFSPCNKLIDTCLDVRIRGPQAQINIPGIKNDYFPAKPMPVSVFNNINNSSACYGTTVQYSTFSKFSQSVTTNQYCNAQVLSVVTDTLQHCNGKKEPFVSSITLKPTSTATTSVTDSTETINTWTKGDPIPSKPYYPSSGKLMYMTMHDSDLFSCALPNMVRFTNNSVKYRLYEALDNRTPFNATGPNSTIGFYDICKHPSYPFASDSLTYLWRFQDPTAKNCTTTVANKDWECNFSTMAAPYHLYKGTLNSKPYLPDSRCQNVQLTVKDAVTSCADSTTLTLHHGPPQASWDKASFKKQHGGYCNMNWDVQQLLPRGSTASNSGFPLRGLMLNGAGIPCAGDYSRFRIDLSETLPACGSQDWWITFDSVASTSLKCTLNGKKVYDYGFTGASNKHGYPVAAPSSFWTNPLIWNTHYWYENGDSGCKTIGIVIKNGNCYDTAWYHNYICFNELNPSFIITQFDQTNNQYKFIDSSVHEFGVIRQQIGLNISPGVQLKLTPASHTQPLLTNVIYTLNRLSDEDFYYKKSNLTGINGFWPDTAIIFNKYPNTVWDNNDYIDSITSYKDTLFIPQDGIIYTPIYDQNGIFLYNISLYNLYLNNPQVQTLKTSGQVVVSGNSQIGRKLNTNCASSITIKTYDQSMPIKQKLYILNLNDSQPDDSIYSGGKWKYYKHTDGIHYVHDSVTFKLPYPGFYTIRSNTQNVQGCYNSATYNLIYGHYVKFWIKGGDSIICVGDTVRFDWKIRYWSHNCINPFGPPPLGCIDNAIVGGYGPPYVSSIVDFGPWDKADPMAYRKSILSSNGYTWQQPPAGKYQNETWAWNFGDGGGLKTYKTGLTSIFHVYDKPGIYDVTLRTTDSTGTTINTVRHKLIKVIGVDADFVVTPLRDTLKICAPKSFTFKPKPVIIGDSLKIANKFGYKDKAIVNGKITNINVVVDSIATWIWNPGDGRKPVVKTTGDSVTFDYAENGRYSPTMQLYTGFAKCSDIIYKTNYIEIKGPHASFSIVGDTFGRVPFDLKVRNTSTGGRFFEWNLGNGSVQASLKSDSIVFLKYNQASDSGVFEVKLHLRDSIYDPYTGKYVVCDQTSKSRWIKVFALSSISYDSLSGTIWLIYPNPTTNRNIVISHQGKEINDFDIYLYDVNGRQVFKQHNLHSADNNMHLGDELLPGIYYLKIKNQNSFITRKIIIQ